MLKSFDVDIDRMAKAISEAFTETIIENGNQPIHSQSEYQLYFFNILEEQLTTEIIEKSICIEFVDQMLSQKKGNGK